MSHHRLVTEALRRVALVVVFVAGIAALVGSGGGIAFLPGDCPPDLDCNGPVVPVPLVQPRSVTAQVGSPVSFTAAAPNVPAEQLTWQWYRSIDGGTSFTPVTGATRDTLMLASVNLGDDGAIYLAKATAKGLTGQAQGRLAVTASPGLVFIDGDFTDAGWAATALPDGAAPAPAHTEEQVMAGGHPGAYRKMVFQLAPQASTGVVAYTSLAGSYNPQLQGAVYVIDYVEDGLSLETGSTRFTRSALLLEQGGRRYMATPAESYPRLSTVWDLSQNTPSLRARDFTLHDGPPCQAGEACPDFSALGAPMRFGYWRIATGPAGATVAHGIDNWKVTVWRR